MKNKQHYINTLMELYQDMCMEKHGEHPDWLGVKPVFSETMKHNVISIINKLNNR